MKIRLLISLLVIGEGVRHIVVYSHVPSSTAYGASLIVLGILVALSTRSERINSILPKFKERTAASFFGTRKVFPQNRKENIISLLGVALAVIGIFLTLWAPTGEKTFNMYDTVLIAFGVFVMIYPVMVKIFPWESRFILFFFIFFVIFVVVVHKISIYFSPEGTLRASLNTKITVAPFHTWLSILGLDVTRDGQVLFFKAPGGSTSLYIGPPCSGYFSLFTFLAVIMSYMVASEFPLKKGIILTFLGLLLGYLANILRLTVLVLVAMYYGMAVMDRIHTYLGTVLFVGWNLLFWIPVLYYFRKKEKNPD